MNCPLHSRAVTHRPLATRKQDTSTILVLEYSGVSANLRSKHKVFPAFDFTLLSTLDILTCSSIYEILKLEHEHCACEGWDWDTLPACRPDTTFLSEWRKTINFTQMVIGQKSCFFSNSSCLRWKPISTLHLFSAQKSLNRAEEKTHLQTNIGKLQNPSYTFTGVQSIWHVFFGCRRLRSASLSWSILSPHLVTFISTLNLCKT